MPARSPAGGMRIPRFSRTTFRAPSETEARSGYRAWRVLRSRDAGSVAGADGADGRAVPLAEQVPEPFRVEKISSGRTRRGRRG